MCGMKIKEPVRLRTKDLSNGGKSLYLDIYMNGERRYEFLKLYLAPETTRENREANRRMLELANSIKASRIVELQSSRYGFSSRDKSKASFFDYFRSLAAKKTGTTKESWEHCLSHLLIYEKRQLAFKDVTKRWIEGFRDYLDREACVRDIDERKRSEARKPISEGTKALYFRKLSAALNQAVKDGIIPASPMNGIARFKEPESTREYLTMDELRRLAKADCPDPELKRAFLFSCLTGLRWSDIVSLKWSEVEEDGGNMRIVFRQQKTGSLEYLDISQQAAGFLGERAGDEDAVFGRFLAPKTDQRSVKAWVKASGIKKHITFHMARHFQSSFPLKANDLQRVFA